MNAPRNIETLHWQGDRDGHLVLVDQTLLPVTFAEICCRDLESVWEAIRSLRVRGAPAIGIAAAYGVCLGLQNAVDGDEAAFYARLDEVCRYLADSRPTAVNLFWALDRMQRVAISLLQTYPQFFSDDFQHNKIMVGRVTDVTSKKMRNRIAGYITTLRRNQMRDM